MGDPGGVGPEVLAAALPTITTAAPPARWLLLGPSRCLGAHGLPVARTFDGVDPAAAATVVELEPDDGRPFEPRPTARGGAISHAQVLHAIEATGLPEGHPARADAICTAPISKAAWFAAGHTDHPGHTELLAASFGVARHAMAFVSEPLIVALATGHLPLAAVPSVLTTQRVLDALELLDALCRRLGVSAPRLGVAGLNPHAGEGGALGDEDQRLIAPAVERALHAGIDARGPVPGDTIFRQARRADPESRYDAVLAMYHDQALAPLKLVAFESAVNTTLGLPVPRTSPDHGTAFDIAGKGRAHAGSMLSALRLAADLARVPEGSRPAQPVRP